MIRPVLTFFCLFLTTLPLGASEVKIFRGDSRASFLEGVFEDVSLDPFGAIELAHHLEALTSIDEPFVFSAVALPDGWVVGTGNSGRLLEIGRDGQVAVLYEAEQLEIFALWADPDGTVFAATSPYGKVIRVNDQGSEEVFDPPEAYIWDLERDPAGRMLVATGSEGRIYRLAPGEKPGAKAEMIFESPDRHVRALQALADGGVLVGTAGQGLILQLGEKDQARTVYDAVPPEVLTFVARPDGGAYAALLASEASRVDLANNAPQGENGEADAEAVTITVQAQEIIGSRAAGANSPRSLVIEIKPDGTVVEVVSFEDETVHSMMWHQGQLWIGTGEEGKLYRHDGERLTLERLLDERQITALVAGDNEAAVVTTNGSAIYRLGEEYARRGVYTSAVLDAEQPAVFGSFFWRGEVPSKSSIAFSFRSGMSLQPDATWSEWSAAAKGGELALDQLSSGHYVQWRAELTGQGQKTPRLSISELSYRQRNQRPVIQKLEVLDPGQILVPNNFNPSSQTFEPWSPNREGIFTTLKPAESSDDGRLKNLWKKGYRTLRWEVKDPNEDTLSYGVDFRREENTDWLPVVEDLEETFYSFDSTVIPDGTYRFRLHASDRPSQTESGALVTDRISEPVVIDHSPPRLVKVERRGNAIECVLEDAESPMRETVYSLDAAEWQQAIPADGLLDGRRESLRIEVPAETRMLLLRVTDAALNVVTLDLLKALP